jgi:hypothetical protein
MFVPDEAVLTSVGHPEAAAELAAAAWHPRRFAVAPSSASVPDAAQSACVEMHTTPRQSAAVTSGLSSMYRSCASRRANAGWRPSAADLVRRGRSARRASYLLRARPGPTSDLLRRRSAVQPYAMMPEAALRERSPRHSSTRAWCSGNSAALTRRRSPLRRGRRSRHDAPATCRGRTGRARARLNIPQPDGTAARSRVAATAACRRGRGPAPRRHTGPHRRRTRSSPGRAPARSGLSSGHRSLAAVRSRKGHVRVRVPPARWPLGVLESP